jgi:hypothetical protein
MSSFLEPNRTPTPAPAAALAVNAPNSEALTNCPLCMLVSANPSPPLAALAVMFSSAPEEIPISHPKSAPASAGNKKFRSTAALSSPSFPPSFDVDAARAVAHRRA